MVLELVCVRATGAPGTPGHSLWITVWETVEFETERRETFVLAFFTFPTPILTARFYFLKPPESLIT